jgi:hypothetical protein
MNKKCKCKCHYNPEDYQTDNAVIMFHKFKNKTICVDFCISKVIKRLLDNDINTLSCCCGHNKHDPEIVIAEGYKDEGIEKIKKLIKDIDDREFTIYQWRLTKV